MEDDMCTPVGGMIYCASDTGSEFYVGGYSFDYLPIMSEIVMQNVILLLKCYRFRSDHGKLKQ